MFSLNVILRSLEADLFAVVVLASVAADVVGRAAFGNNPFLPLASFRLIWGVAVPRSRAARRGRRRRVHSGLVCRRGRVRAGVAVGGRPSACCRRTGAGSAAAGAARDVWRRVPGPATGRRGLVRDRIPARVADRKDARDESHHRHRRIRRHLRTIALRGAMLGSAYGQAAKELLPHHTGPGGAYALVGMAAVFAAAARAPLTSVIIVFESRATTGSFSLSCARPSSRDTTLGSVLRREP